MNTTATVDVAKDRQSSFQDSWIPGWIAARFGDSGTAVYYRQAWRHLLAYFAHSNIASVQQITRQSCFDYFLWRKVARNTAHAELRVLAVILKEAVLRSIIPANPAAQLGIKRLPAAKLKPELPTDILDELQAVIDRNTSKCREFYRVSFAIARYHGVRIAETRFPLSWVNFAANTLSFRQKGGHDLVVPLHPKLRPILLELKERGQAWTFSEPSNPVHMSSNWYKFLKRHGFTDRLPGACFHALRVTTISRLARANVSEAKAKRYVGHSSTAVHAIYQRVRVADLQDCCDAL